MKSVMEAAAAKLAARNMTVEELRRHLLAKGYLEGEVEEVLRQFREDGYLDDARYCKMFFEYAHARHKARNRIFAELRQKGVDSQVMEFAYEDYLAEEGVEVSETEMARQEAEKILRAAGLTMEDEIPEKIRGRVARKLHSYGYGSGLIYEILGEMK
jgi:regulatory protein